MKRHRKVPGEARREKVYVSVAHLGLGVGGARGAALALLALQTVAHGARAHLHTHTTIYPLRHYELVAAHDIGRTPAFYDHLVDIIVSKDIFHFILDDIDILLLLLVMVWCQI